MLGMLHLKFSTMLGFLTAIALLAVRMQVSADTALAYCSSQNTGSNVDAAFWNFQSGGWCYDHCKGQYAYGVVQGKFCWCSDYAPEDQRDIGDCEETCKGWPGEKCGSTKNGLFGYIALEKAPSGTQELPKPTSSSSEKPTSSGSSSTSTSTSTQAPSSSPPPAELKTSLVVVTVGGSVRTIVTTPSPNPNATPANGNPSDVQGQNKGTNVGAIVGGVIGGIALMGAIVGGIFLILWRRRHGATQDDEDGQSGIQRNTSTMSKSGLLRTEKLPAVPPTLATNIRRNSRNLMASNDSISPIDGSHRRNSGPLVFDQRLNPTSFTHFDNTSRGSFNSIDDSRDYGRTLNVRNPDPDPK